MKYSLKIIIKGKSVSPNYSTLKQSLYLGIRWYLKQVCIKKGKVVPLQAWSGPEGSRKLRFPDFMTAAQDGRSAYACINNSWVLRGRKTKGKRNVTDCMDQSRSREANVIHTIKKSLDILLTPLQESAISSCPELDEFSRHLHTVFKFHFNVKLTFHLHLVLSDLFTETNYAPTKELKWCMCNRDNLWYSS